MRSPIHVKPLECIQELKLQFRSILNKQWSDMKKDFTELEGVISDYIGEYGCIPYCTVLHLLAMRYLGAGLVTPDDFDMDHPYRSSKALSVMFWNLGNWKRLIFNKDPLPPNLEKFRQHIRSDIDAEHKRS